MRVSACSEQSLIVGLGNPGAKYQTTRHNVGFELLDYLAEDFFALSASWKEEKKFISLVAKANAKDSLAAKELILLKPQTFMNESGTAIQKLMAFYKILPENILVLHDDVSIEFGKLKLSFNRGAGGQHGIEDTISKIGKQFWRLRVGVGPDPGGDLRADYVLAKFKAEEKNRLPELYKLGSELVSDWLRGDTNNLARELSKLT